MPRADALELRNAVIDRDRYKLLTESLQKSVDIGMQNLAIQDKRVELYKAQSDELSKQLYAASSMNSWEKVGLFLLGVGATIGAAVAVSKVAR